LQFESNPNVAVYRDQFAEMESDFRRGVLPQGQYEQDCEDLERRLLEDCRELRGLSL
jgi:cytochrome c-type biogenesis protein CcmI